MAHSPETATRANAVIVDVENFILRCFVFCCIFVVLMKIVKNIILCALRFHSKKANGALKIVFHKFNLEM
jgi:hypothetical protein